MNIFGDKVEDLLKGNNTFKKFSLINLGASGAGKTTRSLTATQFGPILVRDYDGKLQGCLRQIPESLSDQIDVSKVSRLDCRDWTYEQLLKHTIELKKAAEKGNLPFATIIEDTFTNFSDIIYKSIFPDETKLFERDTMQKWGKVRHRADAIFSILQSIPCNIIINCHVREDENGYPIGPEGKGGFRDMLKAKVTDMHYVTLENGKNMVRVRNSNRPPVNSNVDPKWINPKGFATEFGLKILGDYAYKLDKPISTK